ncbi:MAG: metalloregulator ArsR/SmtB family transcription factor [Archaeoglobaceae archaeon]
MNILDAIGNESRRKILELLAKKPCYVSEISYYLRMAPKVVLEHLEKLEDAGIIRSIEDGKRRYYYIASNVHVEVTISPHRFEVKLASNDESDGLINPFEMLKDIESKLDFLNTKNESLQEIYKALRVAEDICSSFPAIHSSIISKLNELTEQILEEVEKIVSDDLERLILVAIAKGLRTTVDIAECFRIPYKDVEHVLESLREKGIVGRERVGEEEIWVLEVK